MFVTQVAVASGARGGDGGCLRTMTMPEFSHGTRRCYQACCCRCRLCRVANARYSQELRRKHQRGLPPLGAKISAVETWRKIRQLKADRLSQAEIARRLGYRFTGRLFGRRFITLRNALKVRRLCRALLIGVKDLKKPA